MTEWAPRQRPAVVLRLPGDFDPEPERPIESFLFGGGLNLGNDEPGSLSPENTSTSQWRSRHGTMSGGARARARALFTFNPQQP